MRSVILFGNGLGRALDNEYFSLARALNDSWYEPKVLNDAQRGLIKQCLPKSGNDGGRLDPPSSEDELAILQKIQFSCDEIQRYEKSDNYRWLTEHGREFPVAIRRYVHATACQFHRSAPILENSFVQPLVNHIAATRSHVVTLNYDALIYNALIRSKSEVGTKIFDGYSCLFDGFNNNTFINSNLNRGSPNTQAYYLHLHGSPLFYTDDKAVIRKRGQFKLAEYTGLSTGHIVLSHSKYKSALIASSVLLSSYWERLKEIMSETRSIILFGYGGADDHLNQMIASKYGNSQDQVIIVQRRDPEKEDNLDQRDAEDSWHDLLPGCKIHVLRETNILTFKNWNYNGLN